MRKLTKKLSLGRETIRILSSLELSEVIGAQERESIIYDCPTNTSRIRSCFEFNCGPTGTWPCGTFTDGAGIPVP